MRFRILSGCWLKISQNYPLWNRSIACAYVPWNRHLFARNIGLPNRFCESLTWRTTGSWANLSEHVYTSVALEIEMADTVTGKHVQTCASVTQINSTQIISNGNLYIQKILRLDSYPGPSTCPSDGLNEPLLSMWCTMVLVNDS